MERETVIGLREAKARLSEVVDGVRRGRTVLLTLRGRGVARIVPVRTGERPMAELLDELEQAGLIGPAPRPGRLLRPLRIARGDLALRYLTEDRDS
ncbi:MAG: type II toxin-antitoxin system prevent-host-death family antitoxin [Deltaproteobacteria bacterium]|nr:type II toxin-antitoxin system prevent-host-death family antitoxin [Deltaproteobacteria bacterium]